MGERTWSGSWVTRRLGVRLGADPGSRLPGLIGGSGLRLPDLADRSRLRLPDLAGLAVRHNPRRAHLVVSRVLGKHVPVDPRIAVAAGRILGERVAVALVNGGVEMDPGRERALGAALRGDLTRALPKLRFGRDDVARLPVPPLVIGYAETATALGHLVADAFAGARYLHSTRRRVPGVAALGSFDEAHSHATEHLLLPADPGWLENDAPVVLVDDELTTGRTAAATIRTLQGIRPRRWYILATLLDMRTAADRAALAASAAQLGVRIDVVSLASGQLTLPPDVLERGRRLAAQLDRADPPLAGPVADVRRVDPWWPPEVPEGGRHGFAAEHRTGFAEAVDHVAEMVAGGLRDEARVLVLGTEELMYAPMLLACRLADRRRGPVRYSSTTRSPVLPVNDAGYAIRTRLVFPAHDDPSGATDRAAGSAVCDDTATWRYVYNVAPWRPRARYDHVVLVVDGVGDTDRLWSEAGLVSTLRRAAGGLTVVVLPIAPPRTTVTAGTAAPAFTRGG